VQADRSPVAGLLLHFTDVRASAKDRFAPLAVIGQAAPETRATLFQRPLSLASFGGAPHGLDEPSIVKCVSEPRSFVGPFMQIADKLGVDLSYIDCRLHGPARDRGRVRFNEQDT
jgi:hypothetical protein